MSLKFLNLISLAFRLKRPALVRAVFFGWNDLLGSSVHPKVYAARQRLEDEQRRAARTKKPKVRYRAKNCRRSTRRPGMVYC